MTNKTADSDRNRHDMQDPAFQLSEDTEHTHMLWKGTDTPGVIECAECGHKEDCRIVDSKAPEVCPHDKLPWDAHL